MAELATDRVKYQRLLKTSVGDLNHISSRITGRIHEPAESIIETLHARFILESPGDKVLIGISIVGRSWFDKDICPVDNQIVFTEKRAINRETLIIHSPA